MLASLDCVSRQECWEPFLPKHLQRVFNHHKKDNHWSIDVQTENSIPIHQRTKITWEMTNNMKALSSLINHMLPHDQQKKTRFLTSFITPNMTIFASKDLPDVFMMKTLLPHVYNNNFLSLSDSKKVCMGIIIFKIAFKNNYFEMTHEFWPAFMLWKHSIKTDAGSLSDQSAPISLKC
jgi:hypothetical protein